MCGVSGRRVGLRKPGLLEASMIEMEFENVVILCLLMFTCKGRSQTKTKYLIGE